MLGSCRKSPRKRKLTLPNFTSSLADFAEQSLSWSLIMSLESIMLTSSMMRYRRSARIGAYISQQDKDDHEDESLEDGSKGSAFHRAPGSYVSEGKADRQALCMSARHV